MIQAKSMAAVEKPESQSRVFWRMFVKNKLAVVGLVVMALLILAALFAEFITPYYPETQNLAEAFQTPSELHPFGTDEFGRDIYTRVIYGAQQSLVIGFAAVAIAVTVGCLLGLVGGYYGGAVDSVIMRMADIFMAIPSMLMAIAIVAALGSSMQNLLIAIAISSIPGYARIMRASVMKARNMEYVAAARVLGVSNWKIIMQDVLPNSLSPIIVQATMGVGNCILSTAAMSFLGLGIQPPTPEWGAMISTAKNYIRDFPHMTIFPGIAIMLTILALNFLGDGLRDALDPKLRY